MLETYEQHSKKKLIATVLAIVVIAGAVVFADHLKSNTNSTTTATINPATTSDTTASSSTSTSTDTSSTSSTASSGSYRDGTYTATSSYSVPHGDETIAVTLTVSNGVITDSSIKNSESDQDSASYQEAFTQSYKSSVVGKSLSGLNISTVSGASDTTEGFNDAVSQIAAKAQA